MRDLQMDLPFTLPQGYVDASGQIHQSGVMRRATALDEILAASDPRVQINEWYLSVVLLSRVVTHLGDLPAVTSKVIEGLFAADLAYLEDLYARVNGYEQMIVGAICPHCEGQFQLQVAPLDVA